MSKIRSSWTVKDQKTMIKVTYFKAFIKDSISRSWSLFSARLSWRSLTHWRTCKAQSVKCIPRLKDTNGGQKNIHLKPRRKLSAKCATMYTYVPGHSLNPLSTTGPFILCHDQRGHRPTVDALCHPDLHQCAIKCKKFCAGVVLAMRQKEQHKVC